MATGRPTGSASTSQRSNRIDEDFGSTDEVRVYKDEGGDEDEQRRSEENLQEDKLGLVKEGEEKGDRSVDNPDPVSVSASASATAAAAASAAAAAAAADWGKQFGAGAGAGAGASAADPFSSFFNQFNSFGSSNSLFSKMPSLQSTGNTNAQAALAAAFAAAYSNPVAALMMYNQAAASTAKQIGLPAFSSDAQKSSSSSSVFHSADSVRSAPLTAASSNSLPSSSSLPSPTPPPSLNVTQLRSGASSGSGSGSGSNQVASVPRSPPSSRVGAPQSKDLHRWPAPPNPSYVALAAAAMQINLNAMLNQEAEMPKELKQAAAFSQNFPHFPGMLRSSAESDAKEMKNSVSPFGTSNGAHARMLGAESNAAHCGASNNMPFNCMSPFGSVGQDQMSNGLFHPSSPQSVMSSIHCPTGQHPLLLDLASRFGGSGDLLNRAQTLPHGHQSLNQLSNSNAFRNFEQASMRNRQNMLLSPPCGYQQFVPNRYDASAPIPLNFGGFPGGQFGHLAGGFERFQSRMSSAPKREHIKKPLNAFMLFMQEKRAEVVKQSSLKESAAINQILGRMWHELPKSDQQKYYEMAQKEKERHTREHPGWSARDNYAIHSSRRRKRKFIRTPDGSIVKEESLRKDPLVAGNTHTNSVTSSGNAGHAGPSSGESPARKLADPNGAKKCRARYGVENQTQWCKPCSDGGAGSAAPDSVGVTISLSTKFENAHARQPQSAGTMSHSNACASYSVQGGATQTHEVYLRNVNGPYCYGPYVPMSVPMQVQVPAVSVPVPNLPGLDSGVGVGVGVTYPFQFASADGSRQHAVVTTASRDDLCDMSVTEDSAMLRSPLGFATSVANSLAITVGKQA